MSGILPWDPSLPTHPPPLDFLNLAPAFCPRRSSGKASHHPSRAYVTLKLGAAHPRLRAVFWVGSLAESFTFTRSQFKEGR